LYAEGPIGGAFASTAGRLRDGRAGGEPRLPANQWPTSEVLRPPMAAERRDNARRRWAADARPPHANDNMDSRQMDKAEARTWPMAANPRLVVFPFLPGDRLMAVLFSLFGWLKARQIL